MQTALKDEIKAIDHTIAEKIGPQKHRVWFKNSTRMVIADEYLKIGVPNHFIGSWIENHFLDAINQAVEENLFTMVAIFGAELAPRLFDGELPAYLNSAKLVVLPSMQDVKTLAQSRRELWSLFCSTGMLVPG